MRRPALSLLLAGSVGAGALGTSPACAEGPAPAPPAAPGPACAPSLAVGAAVVTLRSGGFVVGLLAACEPGREVVVLVAGTGDVRRIPWAEVASLGEAASAPSGAPPASRAASNPPETPRPHAGDERDSPAAHEPSTGTLGMPRVHIETANPGLELAVTSGRRTRHNSFVLGASPICRAPCDMQVDGRAGELFLFDGKGITQSETFKLTEVEGDVSFRVHPGSFAMRMTGFMLVVVGPDALIGGTALAGVAWRDPAGRAGSIGLLSGGTALIGVGLGLFFGSHTTYERIGPGSLPGGGTW